MNAGVTQARRLGPTPREQQAEPTKLGAANVLASRTFCEGAKELGYGG
jgi:hypothetical protein